MVRRRASDPSRCVHASVDDAQGGFEQNAKGTSSAQ
jgi:hypothetical protein